MPFDLAPLEIPAAATQEYIQTQVDHSVPDGTPSREVGEALQRQGFSCRLNDRKLVCRLERKANFITKEVWILAFDLDESGAVKARRVKHGFIAP